MKGKAIAGLTLGIVGIVLGFLGGWASVASLPVAIVGLVLSVIGGKELKAAGQPSGIATGGLVVGIVAVVLTAIFFFTCGLCTICVSHELNELEGALNELEGALSDLESLY